MSTMQCWTIQLPEKYTIGICSCCMPLRRGFQSNLLHPKTPQAHHSQNQTVSSHFLVASHSGTMRDICLHVYYIHFSQYTHPNGQWPAPIGSWQVLYFPVLAIGFILSSVTGVTCKIYSESRESSRFMSFLFCWKLFCL